VQTRSDEVKKEGADGLDNILLANTLAGVAVEKRKHYFCALVPGHMRFITLACILCITIFTPRFSSAQLRKSEILQNGAASGSGKIQLTDGTELTGTIVFNDNDGSVTFQRDDESRSFNARTLLGFEFYDRQSLRTRRFYSMQFDNPETGVIEPNIFEVLKEFDSFAVLSGFSRIKATGSSNSMGMLSTANGKNSLTLEQFETIYFVTTDGKLEPYLVIIERERSGDFLDYNTKRNKFVRPELFKKYTGEHFKSLTTYAKANDLSFKRKSDLIEILNEFERLNHN
jgi:hypothetical protein